jgi:hypothetical protein
MLEDIQGNRRGYFCHTENTSTFSQRATNIDNFQKDVLYRTVFQYCDKCKLPAVKKVTLALRVRTADKG